MNCVKNKVLTGERAAYASRNTEFIDCVFEDGESPLKESKNIKVSNCTFGWKYPLWYCDHVEVFNTTWLETGRSGVWYSNNLTVRDSLIGAPKQFRRCNDLVLMNSRIPLAEETLWSCRRVDIKDVSVVGDYFGMNSTDVHLENVRIDGNYCFDGGKNIEAHNCVFNSKDSFWNCENVTIYDSLIIGEYLGWNSSNITFVNCTMESNQGLCYMDHVKLVNCKVVRTDLSFELCSDIDADIVTKVDSIKNPISGKIRCRGIGELILDEKVIDPQKTRIEVVNDEQI